MMSGHDREQFIGLSDVEIRRGHGGGEHAFDFA
jgi:hypothetical protein